MAVPITDFIHDLKFTDIPARSRKWAELFVLDLIGVGAGGAETAMSRIMRDHASVMFGGATSRILFDGRPTSPAGAALAGGVTIDALDAHDGYNPAKGHIGCGVFPSALALAQATDAADGAEFLTCIALGYELGGRLAKSLHASAPDYHTSGAWVAVACAALGARRLGLDRSTTRHALGIAEYHGPRSQMMRCIDDPTMVKDGSGWGAMAGVSAAYLAQAGFTGAPAITAEGQDVAEFWSDLGSRWLCEEQYFKPYPVCRWAQAPIEGVLALKRAHNLSSEAVAHIEVETFYESVRLAMNAPVNTEEAQYSTSYPCAIAMVKGTVGPADVAEAALNNPEVARLSQGMIVREDAEANAAFPTRRYARVSLHLRDGRVLTSDRMEPRWDHTAPPTEAELRAKFHAFANPVIGEARSREIETAVAGLASGGDVHALSDMICKPNR